MRGSVESLIIAAENVGRSKAEEEPPAAVKKQMRKRRWKIGESRHPMGNS